MIGGSLDLDGYLGRLVGWRLIVWVGRYPSLMWVGWSVSFHLSGPYLYVYKSIRFFCYDYD
jgi:hypothetical protein|uniref:Transmembrane protein n=1 Tax=Picea glauca TaxID=3330 RepID=A0A101M4D7_PICGL|nr:hypothetical protein ABT39_MTgene602 [Picea glauca]